MKTTLKRQLTSLRESSQLLAPDHAWVTENKNRLMQQLHNSVENRSEHGRTFSISQWATVFVPRSFARIAQPVFTFMLASIVVTGGWIASASASPGDTLYNVKLAGEKVEEIFAADKVDKNLEFADRRKNEIGEVLQRKDADSKRRVTVAKKELEKSVKTAVDTAKQQIKDSGSDAQKATDVAKKVNDKVTQLSEDLKETVKQADLTDTSIVQDVSSLAVAVNTRALETVDTLAETHTDKALEIVQEKIQKIVEGAKSEAQDVKDEVTKNVENATSVPTGISTTTVGVGTSTPPLATSVLPTTTPLLISTTTQQVAQDTVKQVDEKVQNIEQQAQQAQQLVQESKVTEATQKARELIQSASDLTVILPVTVVQPSPNIESGISTSTTPTSTTLPKQ